jgi:hypothetical protein
MQVRSLTGVYLFFTAAVLFFLAACVPTQSQRTAYTGKVGKDGLQEPITYYTGYSKGFQPYKEDLKAGKLDAVVDKMAREEQKIHPSGMDDDAFAQKIGLLGLLERSSLSLQAGDVEKSLYYSQLAEDIIEERSSESYTREGMAAFGTLITTLAGAGEYGRYDAAGFEKVMLLNLKAMDYLLQGDERAFNVARLAIQWQREEKDRFEKNMREVKKDTADSKKANPQKGTKQDKQTVYTALEKEFSQYDSTALSVPNAFVNPFGDYLAGLVNEFKSVKIKSLISNAHISYKQALKLNKNSRVLQQAVKDTGKKRSAKRLIQVVAFDGFAPEKKVLSFEVAVPGLANPLDIEVPTYEPVPSKVKTIKVMTTGGKVLTTLSEVADIEAMAFRYQKDSLPAIQAMVVASTLRDALIKEVGNQMMGGLGSLVGSVLDASMEPNTSSWMSLPATVYAGRFHPAGGLKKIKVVSYDSKGKKLSQQTIDLARGNRHFVFVRSIDKTLAAYPSKPIWTVQK